jgi:hypothetical protein
MNRRNMIISAVIAVIIIVSILMAAILIQPSQSSNPDLLSTAGFRSGDYFHYRASGSFNGTAITGSFNITIYDVFDHGLGVGYRELNTSSRELNDRISKENAFGFMETSTQVGTGSIYTPFGVKKVVETFGPYDGGAQVSYIGVSPAVPYGYVLNAADYHLDLVLDETNNSFAKMNNTESIIWHDPSPDTWPKDGTGGNVSAGSTTWGGLYNTNHDFLHFNITATDVDVYVFSQSNIVSMANGGPFAYDIALTRIHASTESGKAIVSPGLYVILATAHSGDTNRFEYDLQ